jgi:hypothetical protein
LEAAFVLLEFSSLSRRIFIGSHSLPPSLVRRIGPSQDVVERSRQKSDMLHGYGDAVLRAESLEGELAKAQKHSAMLQSKLDGAFAQYHNESRTCRRRATS